MNHYVTGAVIKRLREAKHLTQAQLAEKLCVSDKAVSKWETGKGFPDVSLIESLASVLQVSLPELLSGEQVINTNRAANLLRSKFYVCPISVSYTHLVYKRHSLTHVRYLCRYDTEGLAPEAYEKAKGIVFSEPMADVCYDEDFPRPSGAHTVLACLLYTSNACMCNSIRMNDMFFAAFGLFIQTHDSQPAPSRKTQFSIK